MNHTDSLSVCQEDKELSTARTRRGVPVAAVVCALFWVLLLMTGAREQAQRAGRSGTETNTRSSQTANTSSHLETATINPW